MVKTSQRKITSGPKKTAKTEESAEHIDGRTARAARTREAIIEATIALMNDGDVRPTAPRIAENAGVSLRSVFQHFAELDLLYATSAQLFFDRSSVEAGPEVADSGAFATRLDRFTQRRSAYWESVSDVARACAVQEALSERIQEVMREQRKLARNEASRVFAGELKKASGKRDALDALDLVTGWSAWDSMRRGQRMSKNRATVVMAKASNAVFSAGFK